MIQSTTSILIVEDDDSLAAMIRELLQRHGFTSHVAQSLNDAVIQLYTMHPSVIIWNIDTMPLHHEDTALTMVHVWLKTRSRPQPFVLMSTHLPQTGPRTAFIQFARQKQLVEWVQLPFENYVLLATINRALHHTQMKLLSKSRSGYEDGQVMGSRRLSVRSELQDSR